jgi:hypothetical protein
MSSRSRARAPEQAAALGDGLDRSPRKRHWGRWAGWMGTGGCSFAVGALCGHVGAVSGLHGAWASLLHLVPGVLALSVVVLAASAAVAVILMVGLLASAIRRATESAETHQEKVRVVEVIAGVFVSILSRRSTNEILGGEPSVGQEHNANALSASRP